MHSMPFSQWKNSYFSLRPEPLVRYKLSRVALGTRMEKPGNSSSMPRQKSLLFFLSPHTPVGRGRLARVTLLRHTSPISLLILRKKRLFCSLSPNVLNKDWKCDTHANTSVTWDISESHLHLSGISDKNSLCKEHASDLKILLVTETWSTSCLIKDPGLICRADHFWGGEGGGRDGEGLGDIEKIFIVAWKRI